MMTRVFYRHDQAAVVAALRRGEPIDMATNLGHAPLDDLVALHEELGVLVAVERLPVNRKREGIPDSLLWRTAAVLRFLEAPSLRHATGQLCGEPAILLRLGWSLLQIEFGDNERHPTATGRSPKSLLAIPAPCAMNCSGYRPRPGSNCKFKRFDWFEDERRVAVQKYLNSDADQEFIPAIERTSAIIDGFESPLGMELLATVDWLLVEEHVEPTIVGVRNGLQNWAGGVASARRKN